MLISLRNGLFALVLVAFTGQLVRADFTLVNRGGSSGNCAPSVAPNRLGEDELAFCDRTHEYNDVPSQLAGAQYLLVSNNDKTVADYSLEVSLDEDGVILIFLDNRIGDGDNTDPPTLGGGIMDWVISGGFTDTGLDIGVDEGGDGAVDQRSSVYQLAVAAGQTVLLEQDNTGSRNMYGVACVGESITPQLPAATTVGLVALGVLLIVAGVLALRRRPAPAS